MGTEHQTSFYYFIVNSILFEIIRLIQKSKDVNNQTESLFTCYIQLSGGKANETQCPGRR